MKARSILLVLVTLIIGFVLGMLTSAQIRYHRLKPVRVFFSEQRFRDGFYQAIQPDDQQKAKIDLVLNKYAKINSQLQSNFRKELDASMKEFRKELDLNLTKEQISRLKDLDERRQDMIRQYRKTHENDTLEMKDGRRHEPDGRLFPGEHHSPDTDHDSTGSTDNK